MVDRSAPVEVRRELGSRELDRLELVETRGLPNFLALDVARAGVLGESLALTLRLLPPVPLGFHAGEFELRTNVANQPWTRALFGLHAFGDVVPMQSPVELGSLRAGEDLAGSVQLTSRSGADFVVESVASTLATATAEARRCAGRVACWDISIRARPATEVRQTVAGDLLVRIQGQEERVPLHFQGLYFPVGTNIRDIVIPGPESDGAPVPVGKP
jgi:hypothetical protein